MSDDGVSNIRMPGEAGGNDEQSIERGIPGQEEELHFASQWQLMWRRFKRHKLAMLSLVVLAIIYLVAMFAEFFAPYSPWEYNREYVHMPPQRIRIVGEDGLQRPFVYGYDQERHPVTRQFQYTVNTDERFPLRFFVRSGEPYRLFGLIETDIRLFGVEEGYVFLLGADPIGRDLLSRIIHGARVSTTIGIAGEAVALLLGLLIGGLCGYFGGFIDDLGQRAIEFVRSIPEIPLWMGLAAAVPRDWSVVQTYFAITLVLSFIGWSGIAREVRSKFLSLREEDFIMSAHMVGCKTGRVIRRHMIPSFMSHIIASATIAIPGMIIGETALSFLGLGMRPPAISWGVLLTAAQNIRTVALAPWLLLPGAAVIVTCLAFCFLGDGLRDAADPYN